MSGKLRAFVPGAGVAQGREVCSFEESFASGKQDQRHSGVHLVDQAFAKVLLNDVYAPPRRTSLPSAASRACARAAAMPLVTKWKVVPPP
jgi:hypothetical protein